MQSVRDTNVLSVCSQLTPLIFAKCDTHRLICNTSYASVIDYSQYWSRQAFTSHITSMFRHIAAHLSKLDMTNSFCTYGQKSHVQVNNTQTSHVILQLTLLAILSPLYHLDSLNSSH